MNELTKENLIEYVKCVKEIETSLYSQKRALKKMENEAEQCKKASVPKKYSYESAETVEKEGAIGGIAGSILTGAVIGFVIGLVVAFFALVGREGFVMGVIEVIFFFFYLGEIGWALGSALKICVPIGAIGGLIFGVYSALRENQRVKNAQVKENARVEILNRKITEQNKANVKYALESINRGKVVGAEIEFLKNSIADMTKQLNSYYDLNIIYPKYRGLVYVCSIYEYLKSGRCSELSGPYGAYNMLENDIKYSVVCEKMDRIVSNLEQIKANQSEIYYAICETNNQLSNLENSINKVTASINEGNSKIDRLNETMENVEYNSKISAESEQFTAAYHFFKN